MGEPEALLESKDDDALLGMIAREQSHTAFATLFARYQRDAFSLALHMTGRSDRAEEAVQEAMLDVWRSASRYKPGNARSWLLRVVANASLQRMRSQRRHQRKMSTDTTLDALPVEAPAGANPERKELLGALRKRLLALPAVNRQLVALYYGAGYTQQEIGRELDMPTRTVSLKIKDTLKRLRGELVGAGLASAVPLLESDALKDVLCSGHDAPAALSARVMARLQDAARHSRRVAAPASGFAGWPLVAVLAVAVGMAGVWWYREGAGHSASRTPPVPSKPVDVAEPEAAKPLYKEWNFDKGPAEDLFVFQFKWVWKKVKGRGAMTVEPAKGSVPLGVLLPMRFPARPVLIEFEVSGTGRGQKNAHGVEAKWVDGEGTLPCRYCGRIAQLDPPFEGHRMRIYLLGAYIVSVLDGELTTIHRYERPYPSDRVLIIINKFSVHKIVVRELADGDKALKSIDPEAGWKRLLQRKAKSADRPRQLFQWDRIPESFR